MAGDFLKRVEVDLKNAKAKVDQEAEAVAKARALAQEINSRCGTLAEQLRGIATENLAGLHGQYKEFSEPKESTAGRILKVNSRCIDPGNETINICAHFTVNRDYVTCDIRAFQGRSDPVGLGRSNSKNVFPTDDSTGIRDWIENALSACVVECHKAIGKL